MNKLSSPPAKDGFIRGSLMRRTPAGSFLARHSLAILVCSGLLLMLVLSQISENGVVSWLNLTSREEQLRQEVAQLEQKNRELTERLEALQNDPRELEKVAREEQNMRRQDEEVLMVLPLEKADR